MGFGGVLVTGTAAAAALVAAIAAARRRDGPLLALAMLLAAGTAVAAGAARSERACLVRLGEATSWLLRVHEAAGPGSSVRATAYSAGCRVRASVFVQAGEAPLGARVRATGTLAPAARGFAVRRAEIRPVAAPGVLDRLRAAAREAIDAHFAERGPTVRALLVADARGIAPSVRERFAAAGIVHLLSISGLHVGIIAMAAQVVAQAARLPPRAGALAALGATTLYVAVLGFPAPALRAASMLGVMVISRLTQRPTSPWAALAVGAWLPLVQPHTIMELGYQLSASGIAALIAARAFSRRVLAPRLRGLRYRLARDLAASSYATVVTAPIIAWSFGIVSLVGPLANLLAGPIMLVLQPMLFLAILAAPVPAVAGFAADAARPLLAALDLVAGAAASVPGAVLTLAPTFAVAMAAGIAVILLIVASVSRFPLRPLAGALACGTYIIWQPALPSPPGEVELHVIDVGQGDAVAVRTDRGRWLLVDAGRSWRGGDAGRMSVVPYLRRRGGELAIFVLTHPHTDHVGGAASVIAALRPREYWDAAYVEGNEAYLASLLSADRAGAAWRRVVPGDSLRLDGVSVRVLAPDSGWTAALSDPNEASVVLLVRYGEVRFLLAGDAERGAEEWMLRHAADLRADVLKVGHHGSRTSSTQPFIEAVGPRLALVSVGAANAYGHPSREVVERLAASGAEVLRTDAMGHLVVRTDGRRLRVQIAGAGWELDDD